MTQAAYERLRRDLLVGRLRPGDRLKMGDLCQSLSTNLSAVREALSRLTSEGLVISEPQRGFRAAPISAEELRDLTNVRIEIEALCLHRAIAAGDVAWESSVVAAFHSLSRTPKFTDGTENEPTEAYSTLHGEFHRSLCSACDSPWLLRLHELLYAQSERYRQLAAPVSGSARDVDGEHRELLTAVLARDADRAIALMTAHIELTTQSLLEAEWAESKARLAAG
jgi:DNA-binding GntR family transcriptional regulator